MDQLRVVVVRSTSFCVVGCVCTESDEAESIVRNRFFFTLTRRSFGDGNVICRGSFALQLNVACLERETRSNKSIEIATSERMVKIFFKWSGQL